MTLTERYITAKYSKTSREELIAIANDARAELEIIKYRKQEVYDRYPGVHGRFQQSQLDVLDIREYKVCAMLDNLDAMVVRA